jgi:hypothetical protein
MGHNLIGACFQIMQAYCLVHESQLKKKKKRILTHELDKIEDQLTIIDTTRWNGDLRQNF